MRTLVTTMMIPVSSSPWKVARLGPKVALVLAVLTALGCTPVIDEQPGLVTEPRILAVQFSPAEQRPGGDVTATVLYAIPDGLGTQPPPLWTLCNQRKAVAELGPVAPECLDPTSESVQTLTTATTVTVPVDLDACQTFGPVQAPPEHGEPPGRPTDPDPTGGYFQPLTVHLGSERPPVLGELRLRCDLAAAPVEIARRFQSGNALNVNPDLRAVFVSAPGGLQPLVPLEQSPATVSAIVSPGAVIELHATWPGCHLPDDGNQPGEGNVCGDGFCGLSENAMTCSADCQSPPTGCAGAEPYFWFDPQSRGLVLRYEVLRVSWATTGGVFDLARTDEREDTANVSSNRWTAPTVAGTYFIWVILRDDRGGVSWLSFRVVVQ